VTSRSLRFEIPCGFEIQGETILSQCTAIGFTVKGDEHCAMNKRKIAEQDYEDKIKETFRQLGIEADEG